MGSPCCSCKLTPVTTLGAAGLFHYRNAVPLLSRHASQPVQVKQRAYSCSNPLRRAPHSAAVGSHGAGLQLQQPPVENHIVQL